MLPAPTVTLMVLAGLRSAAALHVWGGAPIRSRALLMDASAPPAAPTLEFGDKRAERRRIMNEERYKRGAAPFDKEVHTQVVEKMSETFAAMLQGTGPSFSVLQGARLCRGVAESALLTPCACPPP